MNVLVKIGSALISNGRRINYEWLSEKVAEIAELEHAGDRIILVSSGAVAAGMEIRDVADRPRDVLQLQLLSGIGQIRLMKYYKDLLKPHRIAVAQVLLTHHNFKSSRERETITQIIAAYLELGVIPIVNENDMVDKEEFDYRNTFTDNDILAALVAVNVEVDLAVLLTDVDGLYAADPKTDASAHLIEQVQEITPEIVAMAGGSTSGLGLGGMSSKLLAARKITEAGIEVIIASGRHRLGDLIGGNVRHTRFAAQPTRS